MAALANRRHNNKSDKKTLLFPPPQKDGILSKGGEKKMITSPNQRIVSINRNTPKKESNKPFAYIYCDAIQAASRNLQGETAFKLWMYLASNKHNYTFAWSPKAFSETYGCSEKSAREAFNQLIVKNYLIPGSHKNDYYFQETPAASISAIAEKREFIDNDTNTLYYWTYAELLEQIKNKQLADTLWQSAKIAD